MGHFSIDKNFKSIDQPCSCDGNFIKRNLIPTMTNLSHDMIFTNCGISFEINIARSL